MHKYQVTFDENGDVESAIQLPDETPRKRVIVVLEATKNKATRAAEKLYPLVK